jgi:regulator of replication initiation timing
MKVASIFVVFLLVLTGGILSCGQETKGLTEEIRLLREENNFLKAENIGLKKEMEELYKKLDEKGVTEGKNPAQQKPVSVEPAKPKENIRSEGASKKR